MEKRVVAVLNCGTCGKLVRLEDAGSECAPLRECSNQYCGDTFVGWERNCPSCNRPFTRKLADYDCEDCQEEMGKTTAFECGNDNCSQCGLHLDEKEANECGKPRQEPKSRI